MIKNNLTGTYTVGNALTLHEPATNLATPGERIEMESSIADYATWNQNHEASTTYLDTTTIATGNTVDFIDFIASYTRLFIFSIY